jgi:hypothetical protein
VSMNTSEMQANDLYTGLKVRTASEWVEVTKVDRVRRRVEISFSDGSTRQFPATYTFQVQS